MPRLGRGATDRWAGNIKLDLAERANALRARHQEWFTKALFVEKAIEYYVEVAEREGLENLPPFRVDQPGGPTRVGPPHGPVGNVQGKGSGNVMLKQWQDLLLRRA